MSPSPIHPIPAPRRARAARRAALRLQPGWRPVLRPVSLAVCLLGAHPAVLALPTGALLTGGQATVQQTAPGQMLIQQATAKAGLDWTSFSIAAGEAVNVVQPDRASVLLNRIVGSDPSLIYGALRSNGSVWLINPRGIVFGAGSRVDVGGLVASTLSISGDALAGGRIQLGVAGAEAGELRSEGHITAVDGSVVLAAPRLLHGGQIDARRVGLVAASEVLVDVEGDGLVFFNVRNQGLDTRLALLGGVRADGGTADIRAAARAGFADTVLNLEGVVQARGIGVREGRIVIDGGASGITRVAGTLDAGDAAGGRGGSLSVQGDRLQVEAGARLHARGPAGGGQILLGGDYQGGNATMRNATQTTVAHGAVLDASATQAGDGGRIIVWSDDTTVFDGHAAVRGGPAGGSGGFVETSGKLNLGIQHGSVDLAAPAGSAGQWLLDPQDINVAAGGGALYPDVQTAGAQPGTLQTVAPATLLAVNGSVTLAATRNITITDALVLTAAGGSLTLTGGTTGGILLKADVGTNNGAIEMSSGSGGITQDAGTSVNAGSATLTLNGGGGNVTLSGALATTHTGNGAVSISNAANLQVGGITTGSASGRVSLNFSGNGTQAAGTGITEGNLVLSGIGTLTLSSSSNDFSGGVAVDAGTLQVSGSTAKAGGGSIVLAANRTLDLVGGASIGNAVTLPNGSATISSSFGGGTLGGANTLTISNNDTLNLSAGSGSTLHIAQAIADGGADNGIVAVAGPGTVALGGSASYGGATSVGSGTLRIDGSGQVGAGNIDLGANRLDITGGATVTRTVLAASGASISSSSGGGTLGGAGALTLAQGAALNLLSGGSGSPLNVLRVIPSVPGGADETVNVTAGTVALKANNTYTGATTVSAGATLVAGDGSTGGTLGSGNLTLGAGATLRIDRTDAVSLTQQILGASSGDGTLELTGGTLTLGGANTHGATLLTGGDLTVVTGGSLGTGAVSFNGLSVVTIDSTGTVTLAGALTGDGTLIQDGTGITRLTGDSSASFTGAINVSGGTLRLDGSGARTGPGAITVSASRTLDITNGATLEAPLTLGTGASVISSTGGGTLGGAGTLTLVDGANLNLAGGSGSVLDVNRVIPELAGGPAETVTVTGGTVLMQQVNTYTGTTTVNSGATLRLNATSVGSISAVALAGNGTLDITAGGIFTRDLGVAPGASVISSSGGGTLGGVGALTLTDGAALNLAGTGASTLTVARVIGEVAGGSAESVAIGNGTVRLLADNTYTGSTTVAAGATLVAGSGVAGTVGGGTVTLGAGATLRIDRSDGVALAQGIQGAASGDGTLEHVGNGTTVLTGSNSYGATLVSAGVLQLGAGGSTGTAGTGSITLAGPGALAVNRNDAVTLGHTLLGDGAFTQAGSGTTRLTASSGSYSGAVSIAAGVLQLDGAASLGSAGFTVNGGTLDLTGNASIGNAVSVANGGSITSSSGNGTLAAGTLTLADGAMLNLAGAGSSTLTMARAVADVPGGAAESVGVGGGTVVLQAANTYTGGTTVASGTLRLDGAAASAGSGSISLGANVLDITNGASLTADVTANGGATVRSSGGGGTLAAGSLTLADGATLNLAGAAGSTLTMARLIAAVPGGAAESVAIGGGTVALQAANTYTGGTAVTAGTLRLYGVTASAGSGAIALGGSTLDIRNGASVANALTLAGGASLTASSGHGTLAFNATPLTLADTSTLNLSSGGGTLAIERVITDGAGIAAISVGTGAVALRADNTIDGTTTIGAGTLLTVGDGAASGTLGGGNVVIGSGGTLRVSRDANAALTLPGNLSGAGALQLTGGTLTVLGGSNNSYSGGTTVTSGTLRLNGASAGSGAIALGANTLDISNGASVANTVTLASGASIASSSGGGTLTAGTALSLGNAAGLTLSSGNGGTLTVARSITDTANNATVTVAGGTVALQTANSHGGGTTVTAGTLRLDGAGATLGSGALSLGSNTLDLATAASLANAVSVASGGSITSSSGNGTLAAGTLTLADGATLNLAGTAGSTLTVARALTAVPGGAAESVSVGGGTVVLQATNTYTGGTTVASGTLRLDSASATLGSGALGLGSNTLDLANAASLANAVSAASGGSITSSSGNGTLAPGTLTLADGATLNLAGAGSSTLTVARVIAAVPGGAAESVAIGGGTVALQAANTYAGGTTVTAGTLRLDGATASAGSGSIALGGNTLDISNGASVANALSLSGGATISSSLGNGTLGAGPALNLPAAATLTVAGAASSTLTVARAIDDNAGDGALAVSLGTVVLTSASGYGGGTAIASGATLALGAGGASGSIGSGAVVDNGTLRIHRDASVSLTLSNAISGGGSLEQVGAGTTVLTGANSYGSTLVGNGVLQVGNGGGSGTLGNGSITVNSPGSLRFNRSGTLTVPGSIVGTGSLELAGSGVAVLTAPASYGGSTNVLNGTLRIAGATASAGAGPIAIGTNTLDIADGASVSGVVTVANGGTITNSSGTGTLAANAVPLTLPGGSTVILSSTGNGLTVNRVVSDGAGIAGVLVGGASTVTLGAVNAYEGSTRIDSGTLVLGVDNAVAAASSLVVDGGTLSIGTRSASVAALTLLGGSVTGTTGRLASTAAVDARSGSIGAILEGSAGLVKTSTGTVTLSGANTYTGATTVGNGTLSLGANDVLANAGALVIDGGSFDINSRSDTVASLSLQGGSITGTTGVLTSTAGVDARSGSIDAILGGSAGLTKTTTGTVMLGGGNTYTGATTVSSGTLALGANDVLADASALVVNGGSFDISHHSDTVASLSLQSGAVTGSTGVLTSIASVDARSGSIGAVLGGSAGLAKTTIGTVTLGGANTYTGPTTVSGGTLALGANDVLADASALVVDGGTFDVNSRSDTVASLSLHSGSVTGSTGVLTSTADVDARSGSIGAILGGSAGLNKTTAGTVTLGGTNTYTGPTTVSAGTLALGANDVLADASALVVDGGTFDINSRSDTVAGVSLRSGSIAGTSGVLTSTSSFDVQGGSIGAILGGSAGLTKTTAGTVTLGGANTYTGVTTVQAGTLALGASDRLSTAGSLQVSGGSFELGGFSQALAGVQLTGGSIAGGTLTSTTAFDMQAGTVGAVLAGTAGLNKTTSGTVALNAVNTYTGPTSVSGGSLLMGGVNRLAFAGSLTVSGGSFDLGGGAQTLAGVQLTGGSIAGGTLSSTTAFDMQAGSVSAVLAGSVGLNKTGAGSVTLSGANTYTGTTTVSTGTLALGAGNVLANAGALVVSGGNFDIGSHDDTVASLSLLGGSVTGSTGVLSSTATVDARSGSIDAILGGSAGLAKTTDGTVTLGGANTYTGTTTVSAGTLALGAGNVLADAGMLVVDGGSFDIGANSDTIAALLLQGGNVTGSTGVLTSTAAIDARSGSIGAILGGSAGLAKTTAGTVTLGGANTYTGTTTVSAGTLTLGNDQTLPSASGLVVDGGTLDVGTHNDTVASVSLQGGSILGSGGLLTSLGDFDLRSGTVTAILDGAVNLVKSTAGAVTLGGVNTYAGATGVNSGTLALGSAGRLPARTALTVASGAVLTMNGDETVASLLLAGTLAGSGTLTAAIYSLDGGTANTDLGIGTLTATGNSRLAATAAAGTVTVSSGTLTLAAGNLLADDAAVTVASNATLALDATDTVASLALAGTLAGSGTLSAATYALDGGTVNANLGAGALSSRGTSVLAGSAAVGSVTVQAGTLTLASAQRLSAAPAVQLDTAGALTLLGGQAFGTLAGSGTLALGGFTLATGGGGDSTFAGVIGGSGGLVKQGSSIFTLTGASTYTGPTRVAAGTLRLGNGLDDGSAGASSGSLATSDFQVEGLLELARADDVTLAQPVAGSGAVRQVGSGRVLFSGNNKTYTGDTTVARGELATASADELPDASAVVVAADARLTLGGRETLRSLSAEGTVALAGDLAASGDLLLRGSVTTIGPLQLSGGRIEAVNAGNHFGAALAVDARSAVALGAGVDGGGAGRELVLGHVRVADGGRIEAGRLLLGSSTTVDGGTLQLVATASPGGISPDAALSGKQAIALPIAWAEDTVLADADSRIAVAAGAALDIVASGGGSVRLLDADNSFLGSLAVVSGVPDTPWSVNATTLAFGGGVAQNHALQSRVQVNGLTVNVGGAGIVADVVGIRADRLATVGSGAAIVARLPYDSAAGTASQLPGLTLELTPEAYNQSFPFGAPGADGGLRVNVGSRAYGDRTLPLDAGYVTVLPRDGARGTTAVLLLGPTVNPAGGYRFFFDGAGRQSEIPVFYNGVLPTTPQVENSLSAAVAVSEGARKERFDEAVRTENVAVRLRAGVIAEVGPAPSATQGTEGLRVPATCPPLGTTLGCAKAP
ncbi:MAG: autotransporter-associated beta strand repeat-containing protein [Rubrivivax sp.]|nr:autotransporter-associated beta strand repeat-containing protein [Rubrivivax sp.]